MRSSCLGKRQSRAVNFELGIILGFACDFELQQTRQTQEAMASRRSHAASHSRLSPEGTRIYQTPTASSEGAQLAVGVRDGDYFYKGAEQLHIKITQTWIGWGV